MLLYKSAIRPIMLYAALIRAHTAKTHMNKLQTSQNKALRTIFKAPWFVKNSNIHKDLKGPTIMEFAKKLAEKFFKKCDSHTNKTIPNLNTYAPTLGCKMPRRVLLQSLLCPLQDILPFGGSFMHFFIIFCTFYTVLIVLFMFLGSKFIAFSLVDAINPLDF